MAYARVEFAPRDVALEAPVAKPSLFRRLLDGMIAARRRQAEREIALYLDGLGGKLTDDAERVIERRFLNAAMREPLGRS